MIVDLLNLFRERFEGGVCGGTLAEQDDAGYHVVIVDDFRRRHAGWYYWAVGTVVTPAGELAEADLRALGYHGNIFDAKRSAVCAEPRFVRCRGRDRRSDFGQRVDRCSPA